MSNAIFLSSSPSFSGIRESQALGPSSSPDFPTLDELVSQSQTRCNPQPASRSTSLAKTIGSRRLHDDSGNASSVPASSRFVMEDDMVDVAEASLIEISPVDFAAVPALPPSEDASLQKKAPAARKSSRAKSGVKTASGRTKSMDPTPLENSTSETSTIRKPPKARRKPAETISRHFRSPSEPVRSKPSAENFDEPLNLETALIRRGDWTPPPKDTIREPGSRSSDIIEILSSASKREGVRKTLDIFQSLRDTYGYELEDDLLPAAEPGDAQAIFKKRKLIEMVSTSNAMAPPPLPEKSPTKQKAPKKKARTITELATAAYAPKEPDLPPVGPADASAAETAGTDAETVKPKPKNKPRVTKRKPKAPKKSDPRMILLSPEAALKQVAQQDFVFGTSSQLVREQDHGVANLPRLRNTSVIDEEEYVTPINSDAIEPPETLPKLWNAGARDADGELLHLEVIDLVKDSPGGEGIPSDDSDPFGYVNPERTPQRPYTRASNRRAGALGAGSSMAGPSTASLPGTRQSLEAVSQASTGRSTPSASGIDHDPLSGVISSTSPPPSSQKRLSRIYEVGPNAAQRALPIARSESPLPASGPVAPEKPNFELCTDAQLARQLASYGFKPVKKRAGMIGLLDECWSSKHQLQAGTRAYSTASAVEVSNPAVPTPVESAAVLPPMPTTQAVAEPAKRPRGRPRKTSVSAAALASTTATLPPPSDMTVSEPAPAKRPRGRPRKVTAAAAAAAPVTAPAPATSPKKSKPAAPRPAPSTPRRKKAPVLEIPDSDSDLPSSPTSPVFSSPEPYDTSLPEDSSHLSLSLAPAATTEQQSSAHAYITKAVTSAPRSADPSEPSWHEKMLMYESVIVEDLAAWLNTGGLDGVGFDGEVSAAEVKGWCEAKSVCCVWKQRVGGQERKRL